MKSQLARQRQRAQMKRNNLAGDVAAGEITSEEAARRRTLYTQVINRTNEILGPPKKPSSTKTARKVTAAGKPPGAFSREASKKRGVALGKKLPGISGILNMEEIAKRGREKKAGK